MIKSMTGYGYFKFEDSEIVQTWEIKSINSKQLNIKFHIPHFLLRLESRFEDEIKKIAKRGKIDVYLDMRIAKVDLLPIGFDTEMAKYMINYIKKFAQSHGDTLKVDYNIFITSSKFWIEKEIDCSAIKDRLIEGLKSAVEDWDKTRILEGQNLRDDLLERTERLKKIVSVIEKKAPEVLKNKWGTLQKRINDLLTNIVDSVDRDRLLQEIAILADKVDITEELVRLKSHIEYILSLLKQNQAEGKRLDFIYQECHREITTCANKSQDAEISRLAVDFKSELEKCREQVQNLE